MLTPLPTAKCKLFTVLLFKVCRTLTQKVKTSRIRRVNGKNWFCLKSKQLLKAIRAHHHRHLNVNFRKEIYFLSKNFKINFCWKKLFCQYLPLPCQSQCSIYTLDSGWVIVNFSFVFLEISYWFLMSYLHRHSHFTKFFV